MLYFTQYDPVHRHNPTQPDPCMDPTDPSTIQRAIMQCLVTGKENVYSGKRCAVVAVSLPCQQTSTCNLISNRKNTANFFFFLGGGRGQFPPPATTLTFWGHCSSEREYIGVVLGRHPARFHLK